MDFGTLKDYFAEIKRKSEVYQSQYPTVSGDFVPFTLGLQYWSGFFTTRQYLKRLGRTLQESIRAADILVALIVLSGKADEMSPERITSILRKLVDARRELDLFQHYDAITGTSKTGVVKDYGEKLSSAVSMSKQVMAFFVEHVIYGSFPIPQTKDENVDNENNLDRDALQSPCGKFSLLSSVVKLSDVGRTRGSDNITNLILYNSFTQERSEIVAFSVSSPYIKITDQTGESFKFDYLLCGELRSLIFFEIRLPPLSISSFRFSKSVHSLSGKPVSITSYDTSENGNLKCENNQVNITFSPYDGSPEMICYKNENFCTHLEIHWRHFFHTGGAYTLSLNNESKDLLKTGLKLRKISGSKQCVVELSHKLINVEYVLKNTFGVNGRHLQVNVLTDLSSSNSGNFVGELAMEVVTSIKNGDTFFTDSNGLQLLRRKFRKSMPFSSNVYPMTSMAAITDGTRRLTIHSVQAHGVVAREPGILDILIDRVASRAEMDLNQKVMDNKPTLTKLFVQFEECESSKTGTSSEVLTPSHEAVITNDLVQHPIVSFFSTKRSPLDRTTISFLEKKVACDMVLANMKCLTNDNFEVDGVTLTLFRRPVLACNSLPKQCGVQSKYTSLSPGKLFQKNSNKHWSVKEMFLTHLKLKRIIPLNGNVSFAEMDMKTFLFE